MYKGSSIAQISKQFQKDLTAALLLSGLSEVPIRKFIKDIQDDIEKELVLSYIRESLRPACEAVLKLYKEQPPEWWTRIIVFSKNDTFPELVSFKALQSNLKKVWNKRPKFQQKRIIERHK